MKGAATKSWRCWRLVVFAVAIMVIAAGCRVTVDAQCSNDDDCDGDERCIRGGGLLVRDGVCVDPDQWESEDVGIDAARDTEPLDDADRDGDH